YRPGDWNTLKVRIANDKIQCYVNDHLVVESNDDGLTSGKVGLAKFRDTRAEFKGFQVAKKIAPAGVAPEVVARIKKSVGDLPAQGPPQPELVDKLIPDAQASVEV